MTERWLADMPIFENVQGLKQAIGEAARKAGRDPAEIQLCAATKINDA